MKVKNKVSLFILTAIKNLTVIIKTTFLPIVQTILRSKF